MAESAIPPDLELLLSRETRTASARTELAIRARRGELVRVVRGAYVDAGTWAALRHRERHHLLAAAVVTLSRGELVLSHASAAALWGLPWLGAWPTRVHGYARSASGGRSTVPLIRHVTGIPDDVVTIDGMRVTSLARTVADIARGSAFERAVVVADAALNPRVREGLAVPCPGLARSELLAVLESAALRHGSARARVAVEFADGRSGSPGETVSRISIDRAGLPSAVLQRWFRSSDGGNWWVDFYWPELRLIGEFDGAGKYLRHELREGEDPGEVVYREKLREDELRRRGERVVRWGWDVARSPRMLGALLREAGLGA